MPTMHEIVGNLGEPLDYGEYRLEDEASVSDDNTSTSQQDRKRIISTDAPIGGSGEVDIVVVNEVRLEEVRHTSVQAYGTAF